MNLVDEMIPARFLSMPVHDEPAPGAWLCGRCPYMNVGPVCTKCGASAGIADRWPA
jgi:ribosomal protein S27AE